MGALLGGLTSIFIGLSDLFLLSTARRAHVVTVTIIATSTALVVGVIGVVVIDSEFIGRDFAIGVGGGVGMTVGLVFYFKALGVASAGVVTPLIAVQTALWPLGYDVLIDGARPSSLVWVGVTVAIGSLLLTTISPELAGRVGLGVRLGIVAGTGFGIGVMLSGLSSEESGMWVLVANRSTSIVLALIVALVMGIPRLPARADLPHGLLGGLFAGFALTTYVYATQRYDLAVVGVTGSMFPAVSAYLCFRFLDHPLRWWQAMGIAGAITGTALIAVG